MSEKESVSENPLACVPVKRLMLKMGIPMILSMMLQAFYNIVDSAFVSNMKTGGELALNALTLAFPIQILMIAFSIGTGVGVNVFVSRTLGQGNREKAGEIAGNGIFLVSVLCVIFMIFGFLGVGFYVRTQSSNPEIISMAIDYLQICCIFSFGSFYFGIFEKLLQSTSLSLFSTIAQISGALVNIILDPVMIYGLLGFPEMGIRGAALATVIGQLVSFLVVLFFHFKKNRVIPFKFGFIKPRLKLIVVIYSIGLPAIISQALLSVMTYGLNIIFVSLGEAVVTAYGLYYKIQQFILFAAFGLRDAIMPIVAFNFGMKNQERVSYGIKYGILYTLCIMIFGTVLLEVFATPFSALFGLSGHTEELCVSAMRVISLCFVFAGTNIALQGVFQALGDGIASLIISILRQFLLVLPVAFVFAKLVIASSGNESLVWWTFLFAEVLSLLVAVILFRRQGFHVRKVFGIRI
ncbi:MAG: MATE family efflux transporter [Treponema sp.]|nr:MATE family efflux transporter [Treponema sp.]